MSAFKIFSRFADLLDIKITRAAAAWLRLNADGTVTQRTAAETLTDIGAIPLNGDAGTPSSLVATNLTGTAAGLTAGAANTLATARTINGESFNGSANIGQDLRATASPTFAWFDASTGYFKSGGNSVFRIESGILTALKNIFPSTNGTLDLGRSANQWKELFVNNITASGAVNLAAKTVAQTNALTGMVVGSTVYVTDETGGSVLATYDGTNWRRSTDRAIIA